MMKFKNETDKQLKVRHGEKEDYNWTSLYPGEEIDLELHYGLALGLTLAGEQAAKEPEKPADEDELAKLRGAAEELWGSLKKKLTKTALKRLITKGKKLKQVAEAAAKSELDVDGNGEYDEQDFEALVKKKFSELKKKA